MPGQIDPYDLLIVCLFGLRNAEKSKNKPSKKKKD